MGGAGEDAGVEAGEEVEDGGCVGEEGDGGCGWEVVGEGGEEMRDWGVEGEEG